MGTMTLVVNGEVVAGTVRTPEATYRIRPTGAGLHAVSQVELSRLPPLGEPIPSPGWEEEELLPLGPDDEFPAPPEARLAPPVPAAFRATEDAPRAGSGSPPVLAAPRTRQLSSCERSFHDSA